MIIQQPLSLDKTYIGNEYNILIKKKGFDPAPFAGKIPFVADSLANPKCVGSRLHTEFWEEQIYHCIHGYKTGGIWLPGKYYEYLNFEMLDGVGTGKQYPYFLDLHYELFLLEDIIRNDHTLAGATIPKARRKGLSFFFKQIILHGARFKDMYRAGVAGGMESFVTGFRSKLYRTMNDTVPELRLNWTKKDDDEITFGWEEQTEMGYIKKEHAAVLFRTMHDDAHKLEGEYLDDVLYEEVGEFKRAEEAHVANFPAQKDGEYFKGKSWFIGTGGNMNKGGKTFSTIYANNKSYNLINIFIPGKRYFVPYLNVNRASVECKTPNLDVVYPNLSKEQLLGCEDVLAAQESLKRIEAELLINPDRTKYLQHKQNFPETVEDVFISSGSNNFNIELIFRRSFELNSLASPMYREVVFEWKTTKSGDLETPLQVYARTAKANDPEWKKVMVYKDPDPKYSGTDVMGIDGYNEDQSKTTTSLGAFIVLRQFDLYKESNIAEPGKVPICIYRKRPPRKEQFFEISLQTAIYFNLSRNVLCAAEADLVINYYKNMPGAKKFLAKRPRSFDSPDSKLMHEFGIKMNIYSKPRMISLMQSWVLDNIEYNWFPLLCQELSAYDSANIGSDWDLADALGIALCLIEDRKKKMIASVNQEQEEDYEIDWVTGAGGNLVPVYRSTSGKVNTSVDVDEIFGYKRKNSFDDDL